MTIGKEVNLLFSRRRLTNSSFFLALTKLHHILITFQPQLYRIAYLYLPCLSSDGGRGDDSDVPRMCDNASSILRITVKDFEYHPVGFRTKNSISFSTGTLPIPKYPIQSLYLAILYHVILKSNGQGSVDVTNVPKVVKEDFSAYELLFQRFRPTRIGILNVTPICWATFHHDQCGPSAQLG